MPNCDWFATRDDHAPVLDALFAMGGVEVYQSYSAFDAALRRFDSAAEILAEFDTGTAGKPRVALQLTLRVAVAAPALVEERIDLDPARCDGATFRYRAMGAGLIQFHLTDLAQPPGRGNPGHSHTNHLTRAGAEARVPYPFTDLEGWNFKAITRVSARLNRRIRAGAVARLGSWVVLPGAFALWQSGRALGRVHPDSQPRAVTPLRGAT